MNSSSLGWQLVAGVTAFACLGALVGCLGRRWWVFELASHFPAQYSVLLFVCALLMWQGHERGPALIALLFAVVNAARLVPLSFPLPRAQSGGRRYRLVQLNVWCRNRAHAKVLTWLCAERPDIALLEEITSAWEPELAALQTEFPFRVVHARADGLGIALLSRLPLEQVEVLAIADAQTPLLVARVVMDGRRVTLIGAHPFSPQNPTHARWRRRYLEALAQIASEQTGHIIVLGDLNLTSWSPLWRDLLRRTKLRDSRPGFGIQPSWPVGWGWAQIPIDHCLVSPSVEIRLRRIGPNVGSDHYPVVIDCSLLSA